jgi:hypothetical protein
MRDSAHSVRPDYGRSDVLYSQDLGIEVKALCN